METIQSCHGENRKIHWCPSNVRSLSLTILTDIHVLYLLYGLCVSGGRIKDLRRQSGDGLFSGSFLTPTRRSTETSGRAPRSTC